MGQLTSYEKLSKKEKKKRDKTKRGTWFGVNPVTRRPESSKAYNRRKAQDWKKDSGLAFFLCAFTTRLHAAPSRRAVKVVYWP